MTTSKIQIQDLWEHYRLSKSVWKTGEHFGLGGQTVHERFKKAGYKLYGQNFTKDEDDAIRALYSMSVGTRNLNLKKFTDELGRPSHTSVSRRARELCLTSATRKLTTDQVDVISARQLLAVQSSEQSRTYSNIEKGWYEFPGGKKYYLKSGWETKYATYLEMLRKGKAIKNWEYEPETFWFLKIKRGVRSYTPDFKIYHKDGTIEFHEVKGWMDSKSKTKIKRMRIYHPKVNLVVIMKAELKALGLI